MKAEWKTPQEARNVHRGSTTSRSWGPRDWPMMVYLWSFAVAFLGYLVVDSIFHPKSHPLHWLSALAGGLVGTGLGWLWFRWHGDIP